ncbi:hypothetical protein VCHENC02_1567B, partial [Vibrio harveyi]
NTIKYGQAHEMKATHYRFDFAVWK